MRRVRFRLELCFVLVAAGCRQEPPAPSPALAPAIEAFVATYAAEHPVWATGVGLHAHDFRLDDLSRSAIGHRLDWLGTAQAQFDGFDPARLTSDERADLRIVQGRIAAERFELAALCDWKTSPLLYTRLVGEGIRPLLAHDTAPLATRLAALAARLRCVPRLLEQAQDNLEHPPRVHVIAGLRQCSALMELLQSVVAAAHARSIPPALSTEVETAAAIAGASLSRFDLFLADDLLGRAAGDFRLGRPRFDRKLALALQTDWPSGEVRRRAEARAATLRQRMYDVALPLWLASNPGCRPPSAETETGIDSVVGATLSAIAADHPRTTELRVACARAVDSLVAFCSRTRIVDLDRNRSLVVEWAPGFTSGGPAAGIDPPGRLDGPLPVTFHVQPVPEEWTPGLVTSYLREYNRSMLQVLAMHEAVPGHFVQFCLAGRCSHVVRDLFANSAFVEGWASYAEELTLDAGYGNGDPRLRLVQLKLALRAALNAVLDVGAHCDGMQEAEALALLRRVGFQEEAEASAKWVRVQLSSAQLCTYFVGLEEIRALEAEDRARGGPGWCRQEFVRRLLAHGSTPVRDLRELLRSPDPGPFPFTGRPGESE